MQGLSDVTCAEFVSELASSAPAPGGGGAAAYVGAIGMALGHMVGSLTVGKKRYADVEGEVRRLMSEAQALQEELMGLVKADEEAFLPLSRAYGMPATTDDERAEKARVMEECLLAACQVPLKIMETTFKALELLAQFAEVGAKIAISDVGCGAALCRGALQAARLNVTVNTLLMEDREQAASLNAKAAELLSRGVILADAVFADVEGRLA